MRILVTANHVPFATGGAEAHMRELTRALAAHGHEVELLRFPFKFYPEEEIERQMAYLEGYSLENPNGRSVDRVISLQFPGYGVAHSHHTVWLMHQHRAVYELFDRFKPATPALQKLREHIHAYDTRVLGRATALFANSRRVAERLREFNGLEAAPLYHPPPDGAGFHKGRTEDYIYYPSRLEFLKRQNLLIEAARHLRSPVKIIIGGDGSNREEYQRLIDEYALHARVRLVGHTSVAEKQAWYAHALAVFYGPYDEDYGYVTLEAMLSSKPVITCEDSGGPLEFVQHGETGLVQSAEPEQIAANIDWLYFNRTRAIEMGRAARAYFGELDMSWEHVVSRLLG